MEQRPELAVEDRPCPTCGAPAGSPCRTPGGRVTFRYHTTRLLEVPELPGVIEIVVPADRRPGRTWQAGPAVEAAPLRIGYACSAPDDADGRRAQVDALAAARCAPILSEVVDPSVRMSVPDIAAHLTMPAGRNAGRHPSVASVYRALATPDPEPRPTPFGRP